jgi:hypothetical protein
MMLKSVLKLISFVGLCVALAWVYEEPKKYDSWVAAAGALVLLLGLFLPAEWKHKVNQNQKIRNGSTGIQAGGNVNISIKSPKDQ